jgi:hypothetical protein
MNRATFSARCWKTAVDCFSGKQLREILRLVPCTLFVVELLLSFRANLGQSLSNQVQIYRNSARIGHKRRLRALALESKLHWK